MSKKLLEWLFEQKKESLKNDRYINRAYTFLQFGSDAMIAIPIAIFYGLIHNNEGNLDI